MSKGKILVVDDSKAMRSIVMRTLRQAGYGDHTIIEASTGAEALTQILEPGHQIRAVQPEAAPVLHHPQPFSRAIEVGVQQAVDSLLLIGCRGCHKKRG